MKYLIKYLFIIITITSAVTFAEVKLPKLISDGMILQRDTKVTIWGWADPNEKVDVTFVGKNYSAKANENGEWKIILPVMKAGGPYEMHIKGSNEITIKNILIGDVWVCSGQSNMELTMERVSPIYEEEIANSANTFIRQFEVPDKYNFNQPQEDFESGKWKEANPKNLMKFSATAYFFAKEIYDHYKIPIGLINTALGGSPVQSWMSEETLREFPEYYEEAQKFKNANLIKQIEDSDNVRIKTWYDQLYQMDEGYKDPDNVWYKSDLDTQDWSPMKVPGYWADEKLGAVNGVVWFRREFQVPDSLAGKEAKLNLGRIVDADSVYVNDVFVGTTSYQYPPRRYVIPAGVLKAGKNTIVVRVISNSGNGGFVFDKPYEIISGKEVIDLKGEWLYKLGAVMEPLASQTFIRWKPEGLFNAMLAPLFNYKIKGVIWYQGESNAWNPGEYEKLFSAMIVDWRKNWHQGDFPFLFVQLPNFMDAKDQPSESSWAMLREAQLKTLSVKNTGMAVAIDIGEWNDIHPLNKKDIGYRLSLIARKMVYGEKKLIDSGPIYKDMKIEGNKIILSFTNIGSGLFAKCCKELKYFSIYGSDKNFEWAKAKIEGNKVIVWNDNIQNPVAVRYAWADNPEGANLYNKECLPASPFRTDNFIK